MNRKLKKIFSILLVLVLLLSNTNVALAADGDHTFTHLDVRIAGVKLNMQRKVINMVTGALVDTQTTTITANLTKVEYAVINGVTYSNFSKMDSREWRQSNVRINLSSLTDDSTAVLVVDLVDANGNTYNDVRITYNRAGIQYAMEHCDGYRNGRYDGIDFDPEQSSSYITLVQYDDYVIPVQKLWEDDGDRDGIRPESVTINLYANGTLNDSVVLNDGNSWTHIFTGKPSKDADGNNISYTIDETSVPDGYTKTVGNNGTYLTVTNTHAIETVEKTVTKVWDDNDDSLGRRPAEIQVQLFSNGATYGFAVVLNEANDWSYTWTDLPKNSAGSPIAYTVDEITVPTDYEKTVDGMVITNEFVGDREFSDHYGKVAITGKKIWDDNENAGGVRPEYITVRLLADGVEVASQKVFGPDWTWSFDLSNGVPGSGANPVGVEFVVVEDTMTNYTLTDTVNPSVEFNAPSAEDGWDDITPCSSLNISNTQDDKTIIIAKKGNTYVCWSVDALAPFERELIVASAAKVRSVPSDVDAYTFITGLGVSSEFGMTVTKTEIQFGRPSQWSWFLVGTYNRGSANSTESSLTNTIAPASVTVTKEWVDNNDQDGIRPDSITVHLYANGEDTGKTLTLSENNGWTGTFADLVKFQNGTEIKYTVTEDAVDGYTTTIDGYKITNTHQVAKIDVPVKKIWNDANNQDNKRPQIITFELYADGESTGKTITLSGSGNEWKGKFDNLDKFANGKEIVYTVKEQTVPGGYTASYSDDELTVTNTHEIEKTSISGTKTWKDANNQDGKRPESITIYLKADGEQIDSVVVKPDADGNWKWTFSNLPVYKEGAVGQKINYTVDEKSVDEYSTEINGYNITNSYTPKKTSVTVTKVWEDANNQDGIRPNDITVKLLADGEDTGKTLVLNSGNNWTGSFTELDKYAAGVEIDYTVEEVAVTGYSTVITPDETTGTVTITNTHVPETTEVSGKKIWDDNNDQDGARPESITINLMNGTEVVATKTVTGPDWSWTFTDLPKYENEGTLIHYKVIEEQVKEYSTTYDGNNVINKYTPKETSVTVTKTWLDNFDQDGIRPNEIKVVLVADDAATEQTLVLNEGNNWTGSFTGLPMYRDGGIEIIYTVEEFAVDGYETVITGDQLVGYTITNSHTPETTSVSGSKTWNDNNNQDGKRPESITINLVKNGEVYKTVTVTEEDNWSWSFDNLPKYENKGTLITYSITEEKVEEYTTELNGYDVVNTHAPEKTSFTVLKAWADSNNQDGIRPNDITVELLADGEKTGKTLVLSSGNSWTGSFTDLDKYANGEEIEYKVAEVAVEGYNTVITGDQEAGFTITNSHTPETVDLSGTKTWKDNNNQDGFRPASITINLLADGEKIDTITVTAEDEWSWNVENLPKFRDQGVEIVYSFTEDAVKDYSTEYKYDEETGIYTVINTHTPEKTSVTVTKAWEDNDDQDGIRPEEITVILWANGQETEEQLVLNEENNWTGSFTALDKFAEGKEIVYYVEELEIEGYETVIAGNQTEGYRITNSHTPEVIEISGSKTWDDANNQDGARPESITVNLMANGQLVKTATVTAAENWSYSFENLPKFENGEEIVYAITENAVDGYTTTYDGYNIINSYTPLETSVTVTKAWADSDDEDGLRPSKVTILLYANGEKVNEKLVLTAEDNWSGSFVGLPKYANGVEIVYTIGEVSVEGYNTVIRGNMTSGFVVTNSHTVIPQTGDERTPVLWMLLMLGSVAVVAYMGYDYKKRRMAK